MSKNVAILDLGNTGAKIVAPVAKLSALLALLEHCSLIREEATETDFTGEVNSHGSPVSKWTSFNVIASDPITAKIEPASKTITRDEMDALREAGNAASEAAKANLDETHPWRVKLGENGYFSDHRYRTREEAIEFGRNNWTGKRSGFQIFQLDSFDDAFESSQADA